MNVRDSMDGAPGGEGAGGSVDQMTGKHGEKM